MTIIADTGDVPVYVVICNAFAPCPIAGGGGGSAPGNVGAIPVNFTTVSVTKASNGTLTFVYKYQSSSGNLQDLASCQVGELVAYPGTAASYTWPYPMVQSTPNPTALYGPGSTGGFTDNNSPPSSYTKPYSADSFQATQRLQWECPNYNGGNFQSFVPDITITRSILQNPTSGAWEYQITKSGYTNTIPLP
jgi:hypothetical protein